ncbi:hypothetical protein LEQ03_03580 [Riemerella anatipestifer]|nr:hypothetical protein LEQ05_12110 [Riemerella anatipestifer]WPC13739.1 hypothetical protein LEQ03_03580 [Riemerella anatipestifer]
MMQLRLIFLVMLLLVVNLYAQEKDSIVQKTDTLRAIEKLKYQQQPGLALAASKIFFG